VYVYFYVMLYLLFHHVFQPAPSEEEVRAAFLQFGPVAELIYNPPLPSRNSLKCAFNAKARFENIDSAFQFGASKQLGNFQLSCLPVGKGHKSTLEAQLNNIAPSTKSLKLAKKQLNDDQLTLVLKICLRLKIPELNIKDNDLTDASAFKLIAFARENSFLTHVNMEGNPMISESLKNQLEGLVCCNVLRSDADDLDDLRSINERPLGAEGAFEIANFLRSTESNHLQLLGVGKCGIPFEAAESIAKSICDHKSILNLEIYCNVPDPNWALVFLPLIKMSHLHSLDLGGNGIVCQGASAIAKALAGSSLRELHLDYNNIGDQGAESILASLPSSSIHTLWIHGNPISPQLIEDVSRASKMNRELHFPRPSKEMVFKQLLEYTSKINQSLGEENASDDRIVELCIEAYVFQCPQHASFVRGQSVLSGIVMSVHGRYSCVAFGLGTRFLDNNLVEDRERVRDSHAEVIARRSFQRFLLAHIILARNNQECIFVHSGSNSLRLKPGIEFILFTSTAPCGSACGLHLDPNKIYSKGGGQKCPPWMEGQRKTCSDKIRRWCTEGLASKGIRDIVGKVPLSKLIIGRRYTPRCVAVFSPHVQVVGTQIRLERLTGARHGTKGDSDTCIFWSAGEVDACTYDGKTGADVNTFPTRLSRWWMRTEESILLV